MVKYQLLVYLLYFRSLMSLILRKGIYDYNLYTFHEYTLFILILFFRLIDYITNKIYIGMNPYLQ